MICSDLEDQKWNIHVLCACCSSLVSSIHLTTGCPHCSSDERKVTLEYLCLLQDWYWLSPETSIHSSRCTQTLCFNWVRSVNIPLIFKRILWDGGEVWWGLGGCRMTPTPLHSLPWLVTVSWPPPHPPSPHPPNLHGDWSTLSRRVCISVCVSLCVCFGGTQYLKHWCISGALQARCVQNTFVNCGWYIVFRGQCNKINLKLFLLCCNKQRKNTYL